MGAGAQQTNAASTPGTSDRRVSGNMTAGMYSESDTDDEDNGTGGEQLVSTPPLQPQEIDEEFKKHKKATKILRENKDLTYSTDPLAWWRANESKYPRLAGAARRVLCI